MQDQYDPCLDLDRISFAEWLIQLNACAAKSGYKCPSLTHVTGQLCWLHAYETGLSPHTALVQAEADGIEFGEVYHEKSKAV